MCSTRKESGVRQTGSPQKENCSESCTCRAAIFELLVAVGLRKFMPVLLEKGAMQLFVCAVFLQTVLAALGVLTVNAVVLTEVKLVVFVKLKASTKTRNWYFSWILTSRSTRKSKVVNPGLVNVLRPICAARPLVNAPLELTSPQVKPKSAVAGQVGELLIKGVTGRPLARVRIPEKPVPPSARRVKALEECANGRA